MTARLRTRLRLRRPALVRLVAVAPGPQLRRRVREHGQTTMLIVFAGMIVMLLLGFTALLPLAEGNDRLSKSQSAAEAAALAGAEDLHDNGLRSILQSIHDEDDLGSGLLCSRGRAAARELALRNQTDLVSYCYDWADDRVRATVRVQDAASNGRRPEATAEAEVRFPLSKCHFDSRPTPTPTTPSTPPTPPPTDPPPSPADQPLNLHCGPYRIAYTIDGTTGLLGLTDWSAILDLDEPRLVG